jgi:nucleoside-diphosphate-sugar epimerase
MNLQTIAIFGASGKLGRHILPLLAECGIAVRALVHRTPVTGENVTSIAGDITDAATVREVIAGADAVIQMATMKEDADTFFDVSLKGTFNVLEACRFEKVDQFILLGGDAAQGIWFYPQPIPIDETHAVTAYPGYYAFSKAMEELMAGQYLIQYGVPVTILRSSWVFEKADLLNHFSLLKNVNPAEKGHGFGEQSPEVNALVAAGEERVPILVNEDGVPYNRHIVHIDDVLQALRLMLGNEAAIGESFNIAAPAAFNYRPAAEYLSAKTGVPTIDLPCPGYHSFQINITKARSILGYAPENDIYTMIDRALVEG